ncbi:MAG: hypothetical protein AAF363_15945 [Bacteroidota bacterium]
MSLTTIALLIFVATAMGGVVALLPILKGGKPARIVVVAHGLFAAIGVIVLIYAYLNNSPAVLYSLIAYVVAALGGYYLLYKDLTGKEIPKSLSFIHAGTAAIGTVLLLFVVLGL